jgi:hypothetical protein
MGHWNLDEGSGTVASDASGNGNHGTLGGNTAWITPTAPIGWPNPYALSLDGAGDYVEVPPSAALTQATEFTVMAWVYLIHPDQSQKVVGSVQAELRGGFLVGVDKGKLDPEVWDSTGAHYRFQGGSIPTEAWTHLALTWKTGGQMTGYVNGHQVGTIPASANPIGVGPVGVVMGAAPWNHSVFCLSGAIDDVRLYNRELTAAEIPAEASTCAATPNDGSDVYLSVQDAVDAAAPGATVKVAGTCSGVQTRPSLNTGTFTATQLAVITKSIGIQGGYTPSNWDTPDREANATTLDAEGLGRVMVISGTITVTVQGLHITGGDASDLGGHELPVPVTGGVGGGGLYVRGAKATIADCEIYSNTAGSKYFETWYGYGGGIYLDEADGTSLTGNWLGHNAANNLGFGYGAALYASNSEGLTFQGNVIEDNSATTTGNGYGAGLYLAECDGMTLDRNVIRENVCSRGAISQGGGARIANCDYVTITSNTIADNLAGGHGSSGGGVYLYGGRHVWIAANEFSGNTAADRLGWGGGAYLTECTDVSLDSNRFVRNAGTSSGIEKSWGGGAQIVKGGLITLTNNVFLENQVTTAGSALVVSNTNALLVHTTLAGNYGGDGSALEVSTSRSAGSTASLVNTILFSHTVGITVAQGCTVTLQGTLWQGAGTMWTGAGMFSSTGNYFGDPRFAGDGYHLRAGSAALDKGIDAGVRTDIDGQPRPNGAGHDLGADEFWPLPAVYLPMIVRNKTYP